MSQEKKKQLVLVQLKHIEEIVHTLTRQVCGLNPEEKHFDFGSHEILQSLLRKIFTIIGASDLSVSSRLFDRL